MRNGFKIIDIEYHYTTQKMTEAFVRYYPNSNIYGATTGQKHGAAGTFNLGHAQIEVMDSVGIDFVQISLTPPAAEFFPVEVGKEICTDSNDRIAAAIHKRPDRFGGWMSLVPEDPVWSVKEIDRAVSMGLYGWMCPSNFNGKYLDDPKYWSILEKIEAIGMPIYLHPFFSPIPQINEFGFCLAGPSLGFTVDASLCFMRMIHRGVFDRFPKLKIIMGHLGEAFPFLKNRMDTAYRQGGGTPAPEIKAKSQYAPSYYFENNLWITTSGNYLPEALRCCIDVMPIERIMMSSDIPYEEPSIGVSFIADRDFLTQAQKQALFFDNAKALGFGK